MYSTGLKNSEPVILTGSLPLFALNFAPNFFKGSVILEKSLLERLLSPTKVTVFLKFTNNPNINLANVPELPAFN